MGLIEPPGHVVAGEVLLDGRDLRRAGAREMEERARRRIGMVFQDPLTSLNPALTIGSQIAETILRARADLARRGGTAVRSNCWSMSASPMRRRGRRTIRTISAAACASAC